MTVQTGTVLILNGPSAAGKSSIQQSLQKLSKDHYLRIGIDTFFDALIAEPDLEQFEKERKFDQYTPKGEYIRGIEMTEDDEGHTLVPLKIGPAGDRIIHGMHKAIAAYANAGNHVIVDYILYKPSWREHLLESLEGLNVVLIGVHADLETLEKREKSRNTSPAGHSRSHYNTVHEGMLYDLELNTAERSSEDCAKSIINYLSNR